MHFAESYNFLWNLEGSHGSWKMKKEKSGPEKSWIWTSVLKSPEKVLIFGHSGPEKSIQPARQLWCTNELIL